MLNLARAAGTAMLAAIAAQPAQAQSEPTCGEPYTIQEGDTLQSLAAAVYGDASDWSFIYYANSDAVEGRSLLAPGIEIRIPCLSSARPAAATAAASQGATQELTGFSRSYRNRIRALTADDYRPFTDRSLPAGGMLTELADRALSESGEEYSISWINDWTAHLDPLLTQQFFDVGFPWARPGCESNPDDFRCLNFLFSEPLFEMLVNFYVTEDTAFDFEEDEDVAGKRICRPAGYFTHDLDEKGRNWIKENKVVLLRPQTVRDCFDLLTQGVIDAVTVNEFHGRQTYTDMGLADQVFSLPRAVSTTTLHMVIAKTHPKATTALYKINESLREMQDSGEYQEIIAKHLATFWQDNG